MKRISFSIVLSMVSLVCLAQPKPEKFLGIAAVQQDSVYYANQAEAWHNEILKNPKDETAWKYYYMSKYYLTWFEEESEESINPMDVIMDEISKNIPDTYTYYFCKYRETRRNDDNKEYADKAISLMPAEKDFFDYDNFLFYLYFHNRMDEMRKMAKDYYNSGIYSEYILESTRNELAEMEPNAIFVGKTDIDIIPKLLLIYGNNEFTDKSIIIGGDFLFDDHYLEQTFKNLGIKESFEIEVDEDFASQFEDREELDEFMAGYEYYSYDTIHFIYKFIMSHTNRPMYFSKININSWDPSYDYFNDEGCAFRYRSSDDALSLEDCLEKIKNNYENVDKLDFLKRHSVDERWTGCITYAMIWARVLEMAAVKYKIDGNTTKYEETISFIKDINKGMGLDDSESDEQIQSTLDYINSLVE